MAAPEPTFQRNALAPGILAALALFIGTAIIGTDWFTPVQYVVTILALIVGWFAVQAKHWWWVPVFVAIAAVWNPVFELPLDGILWQVAQPVAAVVFLVAGVLIRSPREPESSSTRR